MVWLTHVNSRNRRYSANKPKVLTGLSQKATWWARGLNFPPSWTFNTTGGKGEPNPFIVSRTEHGKPVALPRVGAASRKASFQGCG
jgi:hypothetical protein